MAKNNKKSTRNLRTKFTLYNFAGKEKAYYLVDKVHLERQPGDVPESVAHSIIIIDRSGSMSYEIHALKETLIKLLTLDEYINFQLVITLISYSSKGDITCHFQKVPIQEVMKQNSPYLEEIRKIRTTYLTCISQAMQMAKSLIKEGELTAITLHSDGYANDSSPSTEAKALLPLVPFDGLYSTIDGIFNQLAEIKVLSSIIAAHLNEESDLFLPEQLEELKKHYLSKNLYINFPTTNEYTDIHEALSEGIIDSRVSYKIDIGSKDILNLSKLHSANKFLDRMYQVYDKEIGEIFQKPTFELAFNENITFSHKQLSSRTKITKVDEFMKLIFNDFLGLENNGTVTAILTKVGADSLVRVLQNKWDGKPVKKEEMVTALTAAGKKLEAYAERIYQDKICPIVFYIGSTGLLPDEMQAIAFTAEELAAKYPSLQFSSDEQEGTFFEVGESLLSVYAKTEYYTKKVAVGVEE